MGQNRQQYWEGIVAQQEASGRAARSFCRENGLCDHTFYMWRKRLRQAKHGPRFARVKTIETRPPAALPASAALELTFVSGERLRIPPGVDPATLRLTLDALRA